MTILFGKQRKVTETSPTNYFLLKVSSQKLLGMMYHYCIRHVLRKVSQNDKP